MNTNSADSAKIWRVAMFAGMFVLGGVFAYMVYQGNAPLGCEDPQSRSPVRPMHSRSPVWSPPTCGGSWRPKMWPLDTWRMDRPRLRWATRKVSGLDLAADGFETLARDVPQEVLPLQNLAIARLLLVQNAQNDIGARRQQARQGRRPPAQVGSAVRAGLLGGRDDRNWFRIRSNPTGIGDEDRQKAIAWLQRATELEPNNAIFWFALSRAATKPRDVLPSDLSRTALGKAYAANPRNIFVLTEWLSMQAKVKDPSIEQTLTAAQAVLGPLIVCQQTARTRSEYVSFRCDRRLEEGGLADRHQQGPTHSKCRAARRSLQERHYAGRCPPARVCAIRLQRSIPTSQSAAGTGMEADTPVRLTTGTTGLPALEGILDLRVVDVDLNGLPDVDCLAGR